MWFLKKKKLKKRKDLLYFIVYFSECLFKYDGHSDALVGHQIHSLLNWDIYVYTWISIGY